MRRKSNLLKVKIKLPQVKNDIKNFLFNEEAKIAKKDIAKLGMSLALLAIMLNPQDAMAQAHNNSHASHSAGHTNAYFDGKLKHLEYPQGGHESGPGHSNTHNNAHANHGNAHANHANNHANHGHGGPCGW